LIQRVSLLLWCLQIAFRAQIDRFLRDERGTVLGYVLLVGVITIPLVMFLAIFGQNVVTWVQDNAPDIFKEADNWAG